MSDIFDRDINDGYGHGYVKREETPAEAARRKYRESGEYQKDLSEKYSSASKKAWAERKAQPKYRAERLRVLPGQIAKLEAELEAKRAELEELQKNGI